MEEIFHLVRKRILASGASLDRVAAGIFLCGGTSLLRGLDQLAEEVFGVPVRRSSFTPMTGPDLAISKARSTPPPSASSATPSGWKASARPARFSAA